MPINARSLHYVFRIANREASYKFYTDLLGMKILRHEEFHEPCQASCNGPFDGMWSKTMVGYGSEEDHFVLELTYNYEVHSYELGNDFGGIHIESEDVFQRVAAEAQRQPDGTLALRDPDGHAFFIGRGSAKHPVTRVSVNVVDLAKSRDFWSSLLEMKVESASESACLLSYGEGQCKLELNALEGVPLERKTAFGRIAFALPAEDLRPLEEKVRAVDAHFVQTPFVSLDTPGKATVCVVILRDPNEHEICFVGDEGFRQLSKADPDAEQLLQEAIKKDDSMNWA